MKISSQILADRYFGLPLGIVLNGIVRLLGMILRINHKLDRNFDRIAIVKYKGLGSIVQAGPLIHSLRKKYPEAQITFITSIQNSALISEMKDINGGIYFDDRNIVRAIFSLPSFIFSMWKHRIQILFDLELYSNISSILSTFSLATNRFGFYLSSSHFRMGLYTHMMFFNTRSPLSQTYLQMARGLGEIREINELIPFKKDNPTDLFSKLKIDKPYFIINVNASDLRIERKWSAENFARLIDNLSVEYPGRQFLFIGSGAESMSVKKVLSLLKLAKDNSFSLVDKTSVADLIQLITHTELMISCDTGPAHIAYAQSARAVILFGPVSPDQFNIPSNIGVIYKNVYCSPCVHDFETPPCKGDNQCMKLITVEEVLGMVQEVMQPDFLLKPGKEAMKYSSPNRPVLGKVVR